MPENDAPSDRALGRFRWGRWSLWERTIAVTGAMVGVLGLVLSIVLGTIELRESNRLQDEQNSLQRAALDSHLEEVMMDIDRHFVAYPQLRRYFYADRHRQTALPETGRVRAQALSTAEMVIDFADDVAAYVREREMEPRHARHWRRIVSAYYRESPTVRTVWRSYYRAYSRNTACILGAPSDERLARRLRARPTPRTHWLGGCRRRDARAAARDAS